MRGVYCVYGNYCWLLKRQAESQVGQVVNSREIRFPSEILRILNISFSLPGCRLWKKSRWVAGGGDLLHRWGQGCRSDPFASASGRKSFRYHLILDFTAACETSNYLKCFLPWGQDFSCAPLMLWFWQTARLHHSETGELASKLGQAIRVGPASPIISWDTAWSLGHSIVAPACSNTWDLLEAFFLLPRQWPWGVFYPLGAMGQLRFPVGGGVGVGGWLLGGPLQPCSLVAQCEALLPPLWVPGVQGMGHAAPALKCSMQQVSSCHCVLLTLGHQGHCHGSNNQWLVSVTWCYFSALWCSIKTFTSQSDCYNCFPTAGCVVLYPWPWSFAPSELQSQVEAPGASPFPVLVVVLVENRAWVVLQGASLPDHLVASGVSTGHWLPKHPVEEEGALGGF